MTIIRNHQPRGVIILSPGLVLRTVNPALRKHYPLPLRRPRRGVDALNISIASTNKDETLLIRTISSGSWAISILLGTINAILKPLTMLRTAMIFATCHMSSHISDPIPQTTSASSTPTIAKKHPVR